MTRLRARRTSPRRLWLAASIVGAALLVWFVATLSLGFISRNDATCRSCHAMDAHTVAAREGAHAEFGCTGCHAPLGLAGITGDGLAFQRRAFASIGGVELSQSAIDDSVCRECHKAELSETRVSDGIRINHTGLLKRPCTDCHGGTGHAIDGRLYGVSQMEECTECHAADPNDVGSCEFCHRSQTGRDNARGSSVWQATHGQEWRTTHGMGELDSCSSCHEPGDCADCHGVALPHPPTWPKQHGSGLSAGGAASCHDCHRSEWCTDCHRGIEMPHPAGFLSLHTEVAATSEGKACARCHPAEACEECHERSAHPQVPGVKGHQRP